MMPRQFFPNFKSLDNAFLLTEKLSETEAKYCVEALKKCTNIVEALHVRKIEGSPISLEEDVRNSGIYEDDDVIFIGGSDTGRVNENVVPTATAHLTTLNTIELSDKPITTEESNSQNPNTDPRPVDIEFPDCKILIPRSEWEIVDKYWKAAHKHKRGEISVDNLIQSGLALMEKIENGDFDVLEEYDSEEESATDCTEQIDDECDAISEPDDIVQQEQISDQEQNSASDIEIESSNCSNDEESDDELENYHLHRSNGGRGGNVTITSDTDEFSDSESRENGDAQPVRSRKARKSDDDHETSNEFEEEEEEIVDEELQELLDLNLGTSNGRRLRSTTRVLQASINRTQRPRKRVVLSSDDEREENNSDASDNDVAPLKKRPVKRARSESTTSSDIEALVAANNVAPRAKKKKKEKETADAEKQEKERIKRLSDRQKEFNGIILDETATDIDAAFAPTVPKNVVKSIILDADVQSVQPQPVVVHESLVEILQPHQAEGIKFLYDTAIESLDRLNKPPGGGILAHCMGLGKTLQVIAFLHTILNHPRIIAKIRRVMVIVPKNVVLNWDNEFRKWLIERNSSLNSLSVFEFDSPKNLQQREATLKEWYESDRPSILIINYEMYRMLMRDLTKKTKKNPTGKVPKSARPLLEKQPKLREYLQNPVICDEGHRLKNAESDLSISISKILTKRRICLTGTPMQNNLKEYHCMVQFVKPHLLGTWKEFRNQFASVITKGRTKDATYADVRKMKNRCHVLNRKLKNIINRKDSAYLKKVVPEKQEYVIHVHLTQKQIDLYRYYLDNFCNISIGERGKALFKNYHIFNRICTHPYQLVAYAKSAKANEIVDDMINSSGSDSESISRPVSPDSIAAATWYEASELINEADKKAFNNSNKGMLVMEILKQCESVGDKLLLFSQSLESIRFIIRMLQHYEGTWFDDHSCMSRKDEKWGWRRNRDYAVIDGSVPTRNREEIQERFNNSSNMRLRLMIISTRAGGLGTNFVAANRVIIFDCSWNPSHDTQAMFRTYRIGQVKPVYVYRLVTSGTLESMIYKRQVTKESTSRRVVDAEQVRRHFDSHDLELLYKLDATGYTPEQETIIPPKDKLLIAVFLKLPQSYFDCVAHDSLLAHDEAENLTEEEKKTAWEEYEREKDRRHLNLQFAENMFINSFRQFTQRIMHQISPGLSDKLREKLLDNGVDPADICSFALFLATFEEIVNNVPESAKNSHMDFDPLQFIIETTSTDTVEQALLACRNKLREMHRTWAHVSVLRPQFDNLEKCPYLLSDFVANGQYPQR